MALVLISSHLFNSLPKHIQTLQTLWHKSSSPIIPVMNSVPLSHPEIMPFEYLMQQKDRKKVKISVKDTCSFIGAIFGILQGVCVGRVLLTCSHISNMDFLRIPGLSFSAVFIIPKEASFHDFLKINRTLGPEAGS